MADKIVIDRKMLFPQQQDFFQGIRIARPILGSSYIDRICNYAYRVSEENAQSLEVKQPVGYCIVASPDNKSFLFHEREFVSAVFSAPPALEDILSPELMSSALLRVIHKKHIFPGPHQVQILGYMNVEKTVQEEQEFFDANNFSVPDDYRANKQRFGVCYLLTLERAIDGNFKPYRELVDSCMSASFIDMWSRLGLILLSHKLYPPSQNTNVINSLSAR